MTSPDPTLQRRRVASPPPTDPQTRAEQLAVAARALRAAEHICILTGAGVSAESGVPTFREALTGQWARHAPEELASPKGFADDPQRVWQWYAERRGEVSRALPNPAHTALAALATRVAHCTLITQNVDDLHERGGSPSVLRLHGSLFQVRCSAACGARGEAPEGAPTDPIPACPQCGALMRPDVVWFGEPLPMDLFEAARSAAIACDVFLSVGTSNLVEPAASLPWIAAAHGATVIVVNPTMAGQRSGPSILPIEGPAGVMLPRLMAEAFAGRRVRRQDPPGAR